MDYFDNDAPQTPDIYCWNVVIGISVVQYFLTVWPSFLFIQKIDELWRHIFRSSKSILFEILEKEAWSIVYKFESVPLHIIKEVDENVGSLDIRVHYVSALEQL